MSLNDKLIIPLINKHITPEDLTLESGFINIFYTDINKPYLDNHIFLLYLSDAKTEQAYDRMYKFMNFDNLYKMYYIRINNVPITVYAFTPINPAINRLRNNAHMFSNDDVWRIISFWNLKDEDVNMFTVDRYNTELYKPFESRMIPEEDYIPDDVL